MGMVAAGVAALSGAPESEDSVVLAADIDLGDIIMGELLEIGDSIINVQRFRLCSIWRMFETKNSPLSNPVDSDIMIWTWERRVLIPTKPCGGRLSNDRIIKVTTVA
jgi:hypothetical protein